MNVTNYNDSAILAIDSVLTPPPNISTILNNASYDLTSTAAFLNSTTFPNGPSLLDKLSEAHGLTVFAPNNAGVQAAQSSLAGLSNNATAVLNILSNHVRHSFLLLVDRCAKQSRQIDHQRNNGLLDKHNQQDHPCIVRWSTLRFLRQLYRIICFRRRIQPGPDRGTECIDIKRRHSHRQWCDA